MRIARLAEENPRTQGPERRAWYRRHSPAHLRAVAALVEDALARRSAGGPSRAVVLGAGACTEAPRSGSREASSRCCWWISMCRGWRAPAMSYLPHCAAGWICSRLISLEG